MRALSRIVWREGMHLAQHHFQAQNAYFENVASDALAMLFAAPYGVVGLELDEEALLNGTASVLAARGIMPDGMAFNFPEDPPPAALPITELFSPTQPSHRLLLALPAEVPGRASCAPDEAAANGYRFSPMARMQADETTGGDERPVHVARKNFRLLLDVEPHEGLVTLPLARIQRDGAGRFIFDPEFIGPTLRLAGSRRLHALVARLVEMLEARLDALRAERTGADTAEYARREIANFWFLHALNAALPPLRHALQTGAPHPEEIYLELSRLAGALCTFSLTSHPRELPAYDHDAPETCFRALDRHIRRHLEVILPSDAVTLPLTRTEESFYRAPVTDRRCLEPSARWYLGVRSSAPAADVVTKVPRVVKICSAKVIAWLVNKAFAGLGVEHAAVAPAELSPRIGMHYFALTRTEPCWSNIVETGEVGLYVPASIAGAELELKVILERRE